MFWKIGLPLLLGLLMAACGRPLAVERAQEEGFLLLGNGPDPQALDPQITTGTSELNIHMALFEGLVSPDPRTLEPVPAVAESWEVSEDGRRYVFSLRSSARWSDGSQVTAEDFVFAWKRMLSPELAAPNAWMLYAIDAAESYNKNEVGSEELGIRALDSETLELRLEAATPYLLDMMMHPAWFPVHRPTIERWGDVHDRSNRWAETGRHVGNGPFKLREWRANVWVETVANPYYWDADTVSLNGIRFMVYEEPSAQERAFLGGQLHVSSTVPPARISWWKRERSEELHLDPYLGTYYVLVNHRHPQLSDPRIRKALSLAVDRRALVENLLGAGEIAAHSFVPESMPGYDAPQMPGFNPERARELLVEAGYPGGNGFPRIQYLYNTSENHRRIAEALQGMWEQHLGISIELYNQEWRVYLDRRERGDYALARAVWIGDYVDPDTFLSLWSTGSGRVWSGWEQPEFDALMLRANQEQDADKRMQQLAQAEHILLEEQAVIPLYFYVSSSLKRPEVKGWHPTLLNWHPYKHLYFDSSDNNPPVHQ